MRLLPRAAVLPLGSSRERCSPAALLAAAAQPGRGPCRSLPRVRAGRLPLLLERDHRPARRRRAALSRGRRRGHEGNVYVADQLSYVVQKFSAAGVARDRVGLLRRRPRPVRPDRRPRHRRGGQRLRGRLEPQPDREVRPLRRIHHGLGPLRHRTRPVQLRLLAEPHPTTRRRDRRRRQLRVRGRHAATTGSSASTSKAENPRSGAPRQRRRASSPTRAAWPPTPPRCSSPTTTTTASRNSAPKAQFQAAAAPNGTDRASSASPTASRSTPPATCTWPTTSTTASSSSPRRSASSPHGAASAPNRASSRSRAGSPATRPATPTWPTPPTTASRCSTRTATTCARSASPRAGPGVLTGAARARDRPHRPAARLRHGRQPRPGVRAGHRRLRRHLDARRAATPRLRRPAGIARRPARLGVCRRSRRRAGRAPVGRRHLPLRTRRPADLGGAGSAAPARWPWRAAHGRSLRGRHATTTACSSTAPRATLLAKWGAGEGNGAAGCGPGEFNHPDGGRRRRRRRRVRRRHRQQPRRRALARRRRARRSGARAGTADGRFRSPTGIAVDAAGSVYVVDSENNRVAGVRPRRALPGEVGRARASAPANSPSRPRSRWTATATCTSPTPTTTASSASTSPPRPAPAACAPGAWPPPLDVAPRAAVSLPRSAGVLARRALALTRQLPARLQGARLRHALAARRRARRAADRRAARSLPAALPGHAAPAPRPRGAARACARELGRHRRTDGARHDRRRRPDRAAHDVSRTYAVTR